MKIVLLLIIGILKICIGGCLFEIIRVNRFNKIKINGFVVFNLNFYVDILWF